MEIEDAPLLLIGIVRKFVAEGARVLIADLNLAGAQRLSDELGTGTIATETNVSDNASVQAMAKTALSELGGITEVFIIVFAFIGSSYNDLALSLKSIRAIYFDKFDASDSFKPLKLKLSVGKVLK